MKEGLLLIAGMIMPFLIIIIASKHFYIKELEHKLDVANFPEMIEIEQKKAVKELALATLDFKEREVKLARDFKESNIELKIPKETFYNHIKAMDGNFVYLNFNGKDTINISGSMNKGSVKCSYTQIQK